MAGSKGGDGNGGIELDLARVPRGSRAEVVRVDAEGADGERMKALGLCEGRVLEVLRAGDPLIVRVHGSRFGLAAERARRIWVRVERSGEPAPE